VNVTNKGEHRIFKMPKGRRIGNGASRFPTKGWGEVRGAAGYIVIWGPDRPGFDVAELARIVEFPHGEWLTDAGDDADAVSGVELDAFKAKHTEGDVGRIKVYEAALAKREPTESRHEYATPIACQIAREAAGGLVPAKEAFAALERWWDELPDESRKLTKKELRGIERWAVGQLTPERVEEVRAQAAAELEERAFFNEHIAEFAELAETTEADDEHLPAEFWEARPELLHIRQAAHSRTESADVVFHAALARVAGISPHTLKLPAIVGSPKPLSYFVGLVGPSGFGKSSGHDVAQDLLPAPQWVLDGLPIGSGEGLAEALFESVPVTDDAGSSKIRFEKQQTKHNAIVYVDEGEALSQLGKRSGSTLLSTLRAIWTGGTIGQTNATATTKRHVPRGTYTVGFMIALQPEIAGDLLADSGVGTPQRFGWAWATDPTIPDEPVSWPGELDWTALPRIDGQEFAVDPAIASEIRAGKLAKTRGEKVADLAESHGPLMRLKVAGLLAVLAGRDNINTEDWSLAEMVMKTSRAVRLKIEAIVAAEAARKEAHMTQTLARRHVAAVSAVGADLVEQVAKKIVGLVADAGSEGLAPRKIRPALSRRQRDVEQEAVALCLDKGWLVRQSSLVGGQKTERFHVA